MMHDWKDLIQPFFYVEGDTWASVCLNVSEYKDEIFQMRADEGFTGNGYDWASLAQVFLAEQRADLLDKIQFDPESSMFCAYSRNLEALEKLAELLFKASQESEFLRQAIEAADPEGMD